MKGGRESKERGERRRTYVRGSRNRARHQRSRAVAVAVRRRG